jgi:hypothetical protein
LEQVIASSTIRQVLLDCNGVNAQRCKLTLEVTLWVVLAMGLFTDISIRQLFKRTRFARKGVATPVRSTLCLPRQRLGVAPVRRLFQQTVRPFSAPETPGAFYKGYCLMGIDGSVFNLPDCPANERTFGRPSGGHRGEGAFPQLRKISLVELGTHVETALVAKPLTTGEQAVVPALLKHFPQDGLLLWDRGYFSYSLWKTLTERGIPVLARVGKHSILQPRKHLRSGNSGSICVRNASGMRHGASICFLLAGMATSSVLPSSLTPNKTLQSRSFSKRLLPKVY